MSQYLQPKIIVYKNDTIYIYSLSVYALETL